MTPVKDESFNIIDSFRIIEQIVPTNEDAGWEVLIKVDHSVRNVVDMMLWGPVYSKIERMHGL